MGKLIRHFLVDGDADGMRTLEISNHTIYCTIFPRTMLKKFASRPEYSKPGVYILLGESLESDETMVYIGEGDPVGCRLESHSGKKDFWSLAMAFTSKDDYLTKTQIQYIESSLISTANEAHRVKLDNANMPTLPNISEVDRAEVESFLSSLLLLVKSQGYNFFTSVIVSKEELNTVDARSPLFEFTGSKYPNMHGKMQIINNKYILLKGSKLKKDMFKSAGNTVMKIRNELVGSGVLEDSVTHYTLLEDVQYKSASAAGVAVYGCNINGMTCWKYNNQTLVEYENSLKI